MIAIATSYLAQCHLQRARITTLAKDMRVSYTTVNRRLRAGGTSFRKLVAKERMSRLMAELESHPKANGTRLAIVAGFSDHQGAERFFKSHAGMTLSEFKSREIKDHV